MRRARCRQLALRPLAGTWFRAIRPHFFPTALSVGHTATIPGRFNAGSVTRPGFQVLYLAEDHMVALFEVSALLGSALPGQAFLPNPAHPWAIVNVDVQLSRVADLCGIRSRRLIETTIQELTGDWRGYSLRTPTPVRRAPYWTNVPTQKLGTALHATPNIEGFLTYSARVPSRRNLIIFPSKLRPGSSVRFTDVATGGSLSLP
ncbi:MAG TPA: RES family NAD+ phosphorylase [Tepidisphaeraceae bacterium]|nr:RES family NAD+ phosphorylase [Tepidisphaeraceae bacterium]